MSRYNSTTKNKRTNKPAAAEGAGAQATCATLEITPKRAAELGMDIIRDAMHALSVEQLKELGLEAREKKALGERSRPPP
jgi:hypothetical protein